MAHASTSQWIVAGLLWVGLAYLGYRLAERDRKSLGRSLWGLPSPVWAIFWILSPLLGVVLYFLARTGEARRSRRSGPSLADPGAGPVAMRPWRSGTPRAPSAAEQFPAYPRPANSRPDTGSPTPTGTVRPPLDPTTGPDPASVSLPTPPGWYPDPGGRFDHRWWDGGQWTSHVASSGQPSVDNDPDQRIGPY